MCNVSDLKYIRLEEIPFDFNNIALFLASVEQYLKEVFPGRWIALRSQTELSASHPT